jgi:hypothetical protein
MEKNKSILKEALIEYQELKEAANAAAAKKLSEDFPDKFKEYLNEELNKNKHKESEKTEEEKESKKLDETVKEKNDKDMKSKNEVNEKNEVTKDTEKAKKSVNESYEDFDPMATNELEKDDVLGDYGYEKDDGEEVGYDDFDMNEIEREISMMEELETELQENRDTDWTHKDSTSPSFGNKDGVAFKDKLKKMKNTINELLDENEGDDPILEQDDEILTDEDIDEVLREMSDDDFDFEDEIDEQHGVTHAINKHNMPGRKNPRSEYATYKKERRPDYVNEESKKKVTNLIESNKKTTKSLNETRKKMKTLGGLVESYKTALEKYRDQLKNMSVFNTNLAHVNNILINEELALTKKDKVRIINEFKKINSIEKSEEKYKEILSEMKTSKKKPLKENLDEKFSKSSSIQNSSKKALDEVIEKTAYENDSQIAKIKRLSEYIENRGKKI